METLPVVIAVAPNGARKSKADHRMLPITAPELAQCAQDCLAAGASMLHLHVRDAEGRHSLDPAHYEAGIAAIRERVGDALVLQVTTEAAGRYSPEQQMACADALRADAISLAIRELFAPGVDEARVGGFLERLAARGALVQYIVYSPADVARCVALHAQGRIPQRAPQLLFVLGSYAEKRSGTPAELVPMLGALPPGWRWSACAFGPLELRCAVAAAVLGGNVRVGFENNIELPSGATAADNAALVRCTVEALAPLGLRPATRAEAIRLLA